ncbi:MAG TPA: c-type cytochrome [Gemmatimonadaceae bacterium]|nr:c-type cytochrome [Gemmatimonadaceae bacterium]
MSSRSDRAGRRARILVAGSAALLALGSAGLTSCGRGSGDVAGGAEPASTFYIGPQPGPDRTLAVAVNPYHGNRAVLAEGRRLFNWYNCSGCHGDHAGGGMGPSLRDSSWYYGGDESSIFASITEGRQHGMPAWGSKLPRDQIWKIVTYIKSLRTPYEPDAPH